MNKFLKEKLAIILLLTSGASFLLFIKLLSEIIEKGRITLLDEQIVNYIYSIRTPSLTNVMLAITSLGNSVQIAFICIVVVALLLLYKKYRYILLLLISLGSNVLFVSIVKTLTERPRPTIQYALIVENNFSFPSGHTIVAVCFYGIIAYFIFRLVKQKWLKVLVFSAAALLTLLIGFSRIYLGVHWPTDVLGSYLIGLSWFSLVIFFVHYHLRFNKFLRK